MFVHSLKAHTIGIQVWSVDSPTCKYSLSGHSHNVRCLDFFTRDGQQYLVTGSLDKTAKVCNFIEKFIIAMSMKYFQ
jgi:WD40 repeat protein